MATITEQIDGLTDKPKVRAALKAMLIAHMTGDPKDQSIAGQSYRAMTGGNIGTFNRLKEQVRAFGDTNGVKKTLREEPVAMADEANSATKEVIKRTEKKLKNTKKVKPKKAPKEVIKHDWTDKKDRGARVFTPHGVGVVRGYDPGTKHYLIEVEATEEKKAVAENSVRFKAFKEEYREKYTVDKSVRTPSGAYSISTGDKVAKALNGLNPDQCAEVAEIAGLADRFKKYKALNPGMQRMNLGNVLRGMVAREENEKDVEKALRTASAMARTAPAPKVPVKGSKKAASAKKTPKKPKVTRPALVA